MKLDAYSIRARLQPAFVTILPLGLAMFSLFPKSWWWQAGIGSLLSFAGFSYLLAQLVRDRGVAIEKDLWAGWGGKPTTQLLRHSRQENNKMTLARRHSKLSELTGISFPTLDQEQENPVLSDEIYDSAIDIIRDKTRDASVPQHQLIFAELVSYGFRRNLLAMRAAGIFCSGLATIITTVLGVINFATNKFDPDSWICCFICGLVFVWWLLRINSDWVRLPAFAYAARLLESTEHL